MALEWQKKMRSWGRDRPRLDEQIEVSHPLVRLVKLINWDEIERSFGGHFTASRAPH